MVIQPELILYHKIPTILDNMVYILYFYRHLISAKQKWAFHNRTIIRIFKLTKDVCLLLMLILNILIQSKFSRCYPKALCDFFFF